MRKRRAKRRSVLPVIIVFIALFLLVAFFGAQRYMPTNEKMSLYEYFDISENTDTVMMMLNGEIVKEYVGIYEKDALYIPQEWIQDVLNIRFYFDEEEKAVLYTDDSFTYKFEEGKNEYQDDLGNVNSTQRPVLILKDDHYYMDMEFVAKKTDCDYKLYEKPSRIVINTDLKTKDCVVAQSKLKIRYRGGKKSKVLEEIEKGARLTYRKNVDEWVEVQSESGIIGYVEAKKVSEMEFYTRESTYKDDFKGISRDYKISLAWFQVGGTAGNDMLGGMLSGTTGINVISPTWYAITDNSGNMSSFAREDTVTLLKNNGYEVWPLVNDFEKTLDTKTLFGSKTSRTNIINKLISDAGKYGYTGYNIDFEYVKKDGAKDYLQFIREFSVACHRKNLIVSSDNYKAEAYNTFYNYKELGKYVDYMILMGYDEHYVGSDAGSVASISFVEDGIIKHLSYIPKEKVINGMPAYTRIWSIKDGKTTSKAVGMQEAINDLNANKAPAIWDDTVGQYFGSYEKNGTTVKIWVEEERSIEEKLKLYSKYDLAGVAVWKLGLEKKEMWSAINQYLFN